MSWGENGLALKKALGARVHALPNHMHPHAAMLLYQNIDLLTRIVYL